MNETLNRLYEATTSPQGYGLFRPELLAEIEDKSLIEVDYAMAGPNGVAARLSAAGMATFAMKTKTPFFPISDDLKKEAVERFCAKEQEPFVPSSEALMREAQNALHRATTFTAPIPNIPIPPATPRVGKVKKEDPYSFDKLEIGESFFVKCDAEGFKKLSSLVSNRKRQLAPKVFVIRRTVGGDWGQPGVAGAGIWRVADAESVVS